MDSLKSWMTWFWTYIWIIWLILVLALLYFLRIPLKIGESVGLTSTFFSGLTPNFYVALTGTSSLLSGSFLVFEWWYFKRYGTSFIENFSSTYLNWILEFPDSQSQSLNDNDDVNNNQNSIENHSQIYSDNIENMGEMQNNNNNNQHNRQHISNRTHNHSHHSHHHTHHRNQRNRLRAADRDHQYEAYSDDEISVTSDDSDADIFPNSSTNNCSNECRVWKNPLSLFRGPEYYKYDLEMERMSLSSHDIMLTSQDQQTFFTVSIQDTACLTCNEELNSRARDEFMMQRAWREKNRTERIRYAKEAIKFNENCTTALILLAEEESTTISECEETLKRALTIAEKNARESFQAMNSTLHEDERNINVLIYIKRRLGMCARKLQRSKDSVKIFKDLIREYPMSVYNVHENLIEALLDCEAYADVQNVLAKYDDITLPKSATICYTAALIKIRQLLQTNNISDLVNKKSMTSPEHTALEAVQRAVEFNPHVPKYLLEQKNLILPPEHMLKRGDSEAIAYVFFHLQHWKRLDRALYIFNQAWESTKQTNAFSWDKGNMFHPYPVSTENADRELLPPGHELSIYPKKELPSLTTIILFMCLMTVLVSVLSKQYPDEMFHFIETLKRYVSIPIEYTAAKVETFFGPFTYKFFAESPNL
ncbi:hypothetical protein SNEBB_003573 [Seison nebaliae]|nr:hypothetical protein SNEBB_003573 [Seison nebaliae]